MPATKDSGSSWTREILRKAGIVSWTISLKEVFIINIRDSAHERVKLSPLTKSSGCKEHSSQREMES